MGKRRVEEDSSSGESEGEQDNGNGQYILCNNSAVSLHKLYSITLASSWCLEIKLYLDPRPLAQALT